MQKRKKLPPGYRYRADGSIECRITVNGKRYSIYGDSVKEVDTKKLKRVSELSSGLIIDITNVTVTQVFQMYYDSKVGSVEQSTLSSYKSSFALFKSYIGHVKIRDLRADMIVKARNQILESGKMTSTCNKSLTQLKSVCTYAVKNRIAAYNPADAVEPLKRTEEAAKDTKHHALTKEEQRIFFEHIKDNYYFPFFAFLLNTGVRIGEASALNWADIDFKKNVIHIGKIMSWTGHKRVVRTNGSKTNASVRDIPMNKTIRNILRKQQILMIKVHGHATAEDPVFRSTRIKVSRINTNLINPKIDKILEDLEKQGQHIERFTSHALRDTFATRAIQSGIQPNTLKVLMGHSSIKVTMDLYAQVQTEDRINAMDSIAING